MQLRDYLLGLFTIMSGLALTDLMQRLGRLMEVRRTVKWDALPFLAAGVAIATLVINWALGWDSVQHFPAEYPLWRFFIALAAYLLTYLTIIAALPSNPTESTDLRDFYQAEGGYFWTLYAILMAQWGLRYLIVPIITTGSTDYGPIAIVPWLGVVGIAIALAVFRQRWLHYAGSILLLLWLVGTNLLSTF